MNPNRPANRLAASTSPYLLQHAHNPVDWYPWGEEALERARGEQKPIFLSIGYAACHWCHVMERESFENDAVAEILNREFVPIKVDREERPDLDEVYMTATQLMTHSGGWPMSVFLTPDLKPFYAGTYFPPEDRWGRPGFRTLLLEIARAWKQRRATLEEQAERVTQAIHQLTSGEHGQAPLTPALLDRATTLAVRGFDPDDGGFGGAPKFPPAMRLELLLDRLKEGPNDRYQQMVTVTLDRMARGGMYDQVGGGFHRYSVDERWLVPHFEKMLYDNALLARVYARAYDQLGGWYYRRVAREILDYVIREMTHPDGGFYSTTDADSEGEEGKFFVWSPQQVLAVLGEEDGALFNRLYDVTPQGNFEGHSIPNLLRRSLEDWAAELGTGAEELDARLAVLRRRLWEAREQRVHPLLDDKILSGWNGLMLRAFAEGYRVFQDERYRTAAERAAAFILDQMQEGGRLLRSFRNGQAHLNAYLEDHAYLAVALLDLHEATGEPRWRAEGIRLVDAMNERFWDPEGEGYFFTSHDHESLIARGKSLQDGATPSGGSMAALALIRAARLTGVDAYRERAAQVLSLAAPLMEEMAPAYPNSLVAAWEFLQEWPEGIRIPGVDAVQVEAYLSHRSVQPGGRFWVGVRVAVKEGFHVNSRQPRQEYLIPTGVELEPDEHLSVVREVYPPAQEYSPSYSEDTLDVYTGDFLIGVELQVAPGTPLGRLPVQLQLQLQPCDDEKCYPALQARLRLAVPISHAQPAEQHPEVFALLEGPGG